MATQLQQISRKIRPAFLRDPGNVLIVGYIAAVFFFLVVGGLVASKISSQDLRTTSSISAPLQQMDSRVTSRSEVN